MATLSSVGMCQSKNEFERGKQAAWIAAKKSCFEDKWMRKDAERREVLGKD